MSLMVNSLPAKNGEIRTAASTKSDEMSITDEGVLVEKRFIKFSDIERFEYFGYVFYFAFLLAGLAKPNKEIRYSFYLKNGETVEKWFGYDIWSLFTPRQYQYIFTLKYWPFYNKLKKKLLENGVPCYEESYPFFKGKVGKIDEIIYSRNYLVFFASAFVLILTIAAIFLVFQVKLDVSITNWLLVFFSLIFAVLGLIMVVTFFTKKR